MADKKDNARGVRAARKALALSGALLFAGLLPGEEPVYLQWLKTTWHDDNTNPEKSFATASYWSPEVTPTNSPANYLCWAAAEDPGLALNQWVSWPSCSITIWGVANSSSFQVFRQNSGNGNYYSFYDAANSPALWFMGGRSGFATRGPDVLALDRVLMTVQSHFYPTNETHAIALRHPFGQAPIKKLGPGKLVLEKPFRGGVIHEAGTLEIGAAQSADLSRPAGVPAYRFDAAATNTMEVSQDDDGTDRLTRWHDAEGGSLYLYGPSSTGDYTWKCPQLGPETVNGVRLVNFGAYSAGLEYPADDEAVYGTTALLDYCDYRSSGAQEVFFVAKCTTPGYMHSPFEWWTKDGSGTGAFHLQGAGVGVLDTNVALTYDSASAINGAPVYSRTGSFTDYRDPQTLQVYHIAATNLVSVWHCGGMKGSKTAGGLVLAEAIAYTNALTEAERLQTTRYLMAKWHEKGKTDLVWQDLNYLEIPVEGVRVCVPEGKTASIRTVHAPASAPTRGFTKTGAGTLILDRAGKENLTVEEGRVKFVHQVADAYDDPQPAPNPHFWGDATKPDRFLFEKDAEGNDTTDIAAWLDCREGVGVTMTNNYIKETLKPTYNSAGPRGMPCVDFGSAYAGNGARLGLSTCLNDSGNVTYTAKLMEGFIVWRNLAGKDAAPMIFSDYAAVSFGRDSKSLCQWGGNADSTQSSAHWSVDGSYMSSTNEFYGKGVDDWVVIRFSSARPCYGNSLAGYRSDNGGGIQVGEYLFYDRTLTDAERRRTEAYLLKKWKGMAHPDTAEDTFGTVTFSEQADPVLETDSDRRFTAVVTPGTLVKKGAGAAQIGWTPDADFSGLAVQEGVLSFDLVADRDAILPLLETAYFHFDASDLSTLVAETNASTVTLRRVNPANGRADGGYALAPMTSTSLSVTNLPRLVTETIGGQSRTVFDFGPYCALDPDENGCYHVENSAGSFSLSANRWSIRELYIVFRDTDEQCRRSVFGTWEYYADRGTGGALFQGNQSHRVFNDYWLDVDGVSVPYNHVLPAGWHVLCLSSASDTIPICQFGCQKINSRLYLGGQQIAEFIAFDAQNDLSTRIAIRDHLRRKWLNQADVQTRVLGDVSVAAGATLKVDSKGWDADFLLSLTSLAGGGRLDLGAVSVTNLARLAVEIGPEGTVPLCTVSSAVSFADTVTVALTAAGSDVRPAYGRHPILTAQGGLVNAEPRGKWLVTAEEGLNRSLRIVVEGDTVYLEVCRANSIVIIR
ncbi:MAG: hypothetical protein ACI4Q3_05305 [Kiritimatiellia bacterium]